MVAVVPGLSVVGWLIDQADAAFAENISGGPPYPLPARFGVITRTGGPRGRVVDEPQITMDCYARNETDAEELATRVGDWFLSLSGRHEGPPAVIVTRVALAGLALLPDPQAPDHVRYTQTGTLQLRARRNT